MKHTLLITLLFISITTMAQTNAVGIFQDHKDVGNPAVKGEASYDEAAQSYTIKAGGYNIWFNRDEFHYAYNKVKGDFILTANVKLIGEGKDPHRKIGWMVRANDKEDAAHMSAVLHGDGLVALQWRTMRGAFMRDPEDEIFAVKKGTQVLQLERAGKTFIMRMANFGEPLQEVGRTDKIDMPDEALAGLVVSSHNPAVQEEAMAWNVRIDKPVGEKYDGYKDGVLHNRLETMDVFTGQRKVIYESATRFEAPNWMPDGGKLLFNQGGSIYTIPVEGGTPTMLNTGAAKHNNNDHVISFDGKMLGISSHRDGMTEGGSTVYYLPLTGGEPTLVTDSTPSYLHGWSPNGKEMVYTAKRAAVSPAYNIYKKAIKGGAEVALTHNKTGLADGPEYSPDGKYIYFNSTQSGTMQIWRMKPDGSDQEQLTFDEYNNWFPHISPDGKWMTMISFPTTVLAGDHPFYKRVTLRLMPLTGGGIRTIAYLFGGQGTINTPSWSPDSKRIAFVSNTDVFK